MKCEGENLVFYESPGEYHFVSLLNGLCCSGKFIAFSNISTANQQGSTFLFLVYISTQSGAKSKKFLNNRLQLIGLKKGVNEGQYRNTRNTCFDIQFLHL